MRRRFAGCREVGGAVVQSRAPYLPMHEAYWHGTASMQTHTLDSDGGDSSLALARDGLTHSGKVLHRTRYRAVFSIVKAPQGLRRGEGFTAARCPLRLMNVVPMGMREGADWNEVGEPAAVTWPLSYRACCMFAFAGPIKWSSAASVRGSFVPCHV
eukprot:363966-Chlamydomonas_euryale.AAC.4